MRVPLAATTGATEDSPASAGVAAIGGVAVGVAIDGYLRTRGRESAESLAGRATARPQVRRRPPRAARRDSVH